MYHNWYIMNRDSGIICRVSFSTRLKLVASGNAGRYVQMTTDTQHVGSDFDDFLKEEGLIEEVERVAIKRVVAFQVNQFMSNQGLSKTEMARRMQTSRASLDRLLDPENGSVTLQTLERAALALGRRLHIALV